MRLLHGWESFYVIVGAAAGALIGLQFVVITLIGERPSKRLAEASAAFATPTIFHFCFVLALSALTAAPWENVWVVSIMWGCAGLVGLGYEIFVARKVKKQTAYEPVFEDHLFHLLLPFLSYGLLFITPFIVHNHEVFSLFMVGASSLILLLVGVHNAWDAVTYHIFVQKPEQELQQQN